MDWITKLADTLLYFVPALLVLGAVFLTVKKFLDNEHKLRLLEAKRAMQKETVPLRLQAYERMCLFLERISPNSVLVRTHKSGMSARELQSDLLVTIRTEFEHNLSQQIYISSGAWEVVKNAKEDMIRIINSASASLNENSTGVDLSKAIFEIVIKNEKIPTQRALDFLKNEIKQTLL